LVTFWNSSILEETLPASSRTVRRSCSFILLRHVYWPLLMDPKRLSICQGIDTHANTTHQLQRSWRHCCIGLDCTSPTSSLLHPWEPISRMMMGQPSMEPTIKRSHILPIVKDSATSSLPTVARFHNTTALERHDETYEW
jgi:hypothetical protein